MNAEWFPGDLPISARQAVCPLLAAAILFHAMINVTYVSFPVDGSHYDPAVTSAIVAVFVTAVLFLWGGGTLARLRYRGGTQ
ncbi:MAG TPA: hypothetical protein VIL22_11460 [Paenibacillaceae bacterium]